MKKSENKDLKSKFGVATIKTFKSKSQRDFRVSGLEKKEHEYEVTIFWLDTLKFEKLPFNKIEPYLIEQ